jgi:hypothetical protein
MRLAQDPQVIPVMASSTSLVSGSVDILVALLRVVVGARGAGPPAGLSSGRTLHFVRPDDRWPLDYPAGEREAYDASARRPVGDQLR